MFWIHVDRDLSAYCDGELSASSARRVTAHLERCGRCRREYEDVRLGVAFAREMTRLEAPDSLWGEIHSKLDAHAEAGSVKLPAARSVLSAWKPAAAVAAALLVALTIVLTRRSAPPRPEIAAPQVVLDLGDYLRPMQAASRESSREAILNAPPGFAPQEMTEALRAAGLREARISALPEFRVAAYRAAKVDGAEVVQLVYAREDEAFSVFVAPQQVTFGFGKERAFDTVVGGIRCQKVDCPKQKTYAFGEGGFHCVLVSKSLDLERAVAVMEHFIAAHRQGGAGS
jgi:anti-sigma factor RsiW